MSDNKNQESQIYHRLEECGRYIESTRKILDVEVWGQKDLEKFNEFLEQLPQISAEISDINILLVEKLGGIAQEIEHEKLTNEYFKDLNRSAYHKRGGIAVRAGKARWESLIKKPEALKKALRECDSLVSTVDILPRELLKKRVFLLFQEGDYGEAEDLYQKRCAVWWSRVDYETQVIRSKKERAQRIAEEQARKLASFRDGLRAKVIDLLDGENYIEADRLYKDGCADWWDVSEYNVEKSRARFMHNLVEVYRDGALADLDAIYNDAHFSDLTSDDITALKLPKVRHYLASIGMQLDEEQERANARPERRLLIKARAGSGKTRTLCARAALAMLDERLDPNQVMVLAFNKAAAAEVKRRVHEITGIPDYDNARTFHSLAYQLVKPKKKLLFDVGGDPSAREQSRFVQRLMQRILNPAFKESMVEFFRKELEQIEDIGRDLPPKEYLAFRQALELVTLRGERVKSNGEKFIADFLFEHGIEYRYERAWAWKSDFLGGATYKPDFSIVANGRDYILEHWAFDPADKFAVLPEHWDISAEQYREQILAKRQFWREKGVTLLETHTDLMREGRVVFETRLQGILKDAGIRCQRLSSDEIMRRVFENDFTISRMAELFLQFIQRSKKRGWSPEEIVRRTTDSPDREPRSRLFHQLALRAYREYEAMLEEQQAMDFDDLLVQAAAEVETHGPLARIHLGQGRMMPIGDLRWILLDEYQDFSELYFRMLSAIIRVNPTVRLVAVGDDWQAINAFAGAELRFFDRFTEYFPNSETVGVTTNYRSDRLVVAAGNNLMEGRGCPAMVHSSASGHIETKYLNDVWIEFRQGEQFSHERESDALYLTPRSDGRNPSEYALRQAQALKLCAHIICESPDQKTMLLARTGMVYGLQLKDFKERMIQVLSALQGVDSDSLEGNISAMTAHGSKGQEAHRVIILDVIRRQFPKIHPDNLLFEPFGVTPDAVLEDERRLFYVAMTRAEHRLYIVTDKGEESHYLDVINDQSTNRKENNIKYHDRPSNLGAYARKIQARFDAIGEFAELPLMVKKKNMNPWAVVRANVSDSLHELAFALESAGISVPYTEYYLPGEDDELYAEMAWPEATPPVAILHNSQERYSDVWKNQGWRVPSPGLSVDKIVAGIKHYVMTAK